MRIPGIGLGAALLLLAACAAGRTGTSATAPVGACADSLYLRLRSVPVDSLTPREFELFRDRDRACATQQAAADATVNEADSRSRNNESTLFAIVLLVAILVPAAILMY